MNVHRRVGAAVLAAVVTCAAWLSVSCNAASPLNLVPWPKSVEPGKDGGVTLTDKSRIVAADKTLAPLAAVLADELFTLTGRRLATGEGAAGAGDIGLALAPALTGEAYTVNVTDKALVGGANYNAVAMGTVTLLQALQVSGGKATLPALAVADKPDLAFRGLLVDVARQHHSTAGLKQIVVLCRMYKVRFLQLHLSDDQAFTFPSTKFPQLKGSYTLAELKDLVKFADDRGVTIVPEIELPGHSGALRGALPDLVGGPDVVDFLKPTALPTIETLIGEVCDVFQSSPYFHTGSDECWWPPFENLPHVIKDREVNKTNTPKQFGKFINQLNAIVKKHGKKTIVWEGFEGAYAGVDRDVLIMIFEISYYLPNVAVSEGYSIINTSWTPIYVVNGGHPPDEIYAWHLSQFKPFGAPPWSKGIVVPLGPQILGAQMCAWEQPEGTEMAMERHRLPAMNERVWTTTATRTYDDYEARAAACDKLVDQLAYGFTVQVQGPAKHWQTNFDAPATVTITPAPGLAGTVRYTLDGSEPKVASPACTGPIQLTKSTVLKALAFDAAGKAAGLPWWTSFTYCPVRGEVKGLLPEGRFTDTVTVSLKSAAPGELHYTLDGSEPTAASPVYNGPITIDHKSGSVRAGVFADKKRVGDLWGQGYTWKNHQQNLTTGKLAAGGGGLPDNAKPSKYEPNNPAFDGAVERETMWSAHDGPGWLKVDLEASHKLNEIHLYTWYGDGRSYQYYIEVSPDDKTWTKVVDASTNTTVADEQGYRHKFNPVDARYIRVVLTKNTANPAVHVLELRAFEAK